MVYKVEVREMHSKTFTIAADSEEVAKLKIKNKHKNGEINMNGSELDARQMQIHDIEGRHYTDWMDF